MACEQGSARHCSVPLLCVPVTAEGVLMSFVQGQLSCRRHTQHTQQDQHLRRVAPHFQSVCARVAMRWLQISATVLAVLELVSFNFRS